jgi:hypothetical protein
MTNTEALILRIKSTKPMDVVNHPFTFALGVGVANGALAKVRGKEVDVPTAVALALILGAGEAAIEHFDKTKPPEEKRSILAMSLLSIAGVGLGLLPFLSWKMEGGARPLPIAQADEEEPTEGKVAA